MGKTGKDMNPSKCFKMNKPLRILFLANRIPLPIKDGQSRRTFNILKCLSTNHRVFFLSLHEASQRIDLEHIRKLEGLCEKVELYKSPPKKISMGMLLYFVRSLFSWDPYTIWRHYSRAFFMRVTELTKTQRVDLVHCDNLCLAYAVRNENAVIRTITDQDVSYLKCLRMAKGCRNPFLSILLYMESYKLRRLESDVFKQVDFGVAVSNTDKTHLEALCPVGRFEVIENGVDTDAFKPVTVKTDENTLLWIGGFDHYPNKEAMYYFLDSIYPLIKKSVSDIRLIMVGDNVTRKIRNIIVNDPSIKAMGYVDDLLPYLHKSTVFIVPILSGGGTRLKLLEAMGAGKAIVTTSIGCEGLEGVHNKHFLIADNAKQFAECVINVINNRKLQKYLGDNARGLAVEKYDWKGISQKMDLIYRSYIK